MSYIFKPGTVYGKIDGQLTDFNLLVGDTKEDVELIKQKAQEALDSIPEDYTDLNNEVSRLSESIADFSDDLKSEKTRSKNKDTEHDTRIAFLENGGYQLSEEFLGESVKDWLDEHPEATTTVQDHSLTNSKLVVGTLGYVTPEMFGAVGDGETDDTNALKEAFKHQFVVLNGDYLVSSNAERSSVLVAKDNSTIVLNGTIRLAPNPYQVYDILAISNVKNVLVVGKGSVIGDKTEHTGTSGEWGNCISIAHSHDVSIEGITIKEGWGDGIYILDSSNVFINNVVADKNRRNAISIISCVNTKIVDSRFINTRGTAPEAGMAVEANTADDVIDVTFENCIAIGNNGTHGMYATLRGTKSNVMFKNCKTDKTFGYDMLSGVNTTVTLEGCEVGSTSGFGVFNYENHTTFEENNHLKIIRCVFDAKNSNSLIRQVGDKGMFNLDIKDTLVKNGLSMGRCVLWLGIYDSKNVKVHATLDNCSFSEGGSALVRGDYSTWEWNIHNTEELHVKSKVVTNIVHDVIIIDSDSTLAENLSIADLGKITKGKELFIVNKSNKTYRFAFDGQLIGVTQTPELQGGKTARITGVTFDSVLYEVI